MLWLKIKNDFHTVITVLSSLPYLSFWKASENSGESPTLIFQEHAAKRCQSRKPKGCEVKRSSFDSKRSGVLN